MKIILSLSVVAASWGMFWWLLRKLGTNGATIGSIRNGMPLEPLYGRKGVRFDPLKPDWHVCKLTHLGRAVAEET